MFTKKKISKLYSNAGIENIFVENSVSQIKRKEFLYSFFSIKKIIFIATFLVISFSIITGRLMWIQIIKGDEYRKFAEQNRVRVKPLYAERGKIFDRNNIPLVENLPRFSLNIVPNEFPSKGSEREKNLEFLSDILQLPKDYIENIIKDFAKYRYEEIALKGNLDFEQAIRIEVLSSEIPGIKIGRDIKRKYYINEGGLKEEDKDTPNSLAHILGYIGRLSKEELERLYDSGYLPSDSIGKTGIEASYEGFMRGMYGKKIVEVDATGAEKQVIAQEPPIPGQHVILSIDLSAQKNLEKFLSEELIAQGKTRGSAIVMNVNNGEIYALVSLPGYNNNAFSEGLSQDEYKELIENVDHPLLSRAISGLYPSGSVVKPAIAAAALDSGVININTTVLSTGGLQVSRWFFPDWKAGGHGSTNVVKAIAESVNTFFYIIGGGYGDKSGIGLAGLTFAFKNFGLGSALGIELPGESSGFIPTELWKKKEKGEEWFIGDNYNLSIGQGDLLVTPLQIISIAATIANGGTLFRPHIVKAVVDPVTNTTQNIDPQILNKQVASKESILVVQKGMHSCVESGSCRGMLPLRASGKTGTAQWSTKKMNHGWFMGYYPYDKPQIAFVVMIEEGGEGSATALPVARRFVEWWAANKELHSL